MTKILVMLYMVYGRYVTENRLKRMITMEGQLIEEQRKHLIKCFLVMPIATIDFAKQFKGHGWVGIRYQIEPDEDYEIILHIRFKETDARLQQDRYPQGELNLWCLLP
jgi:hypothetical protein